MERKPKIPIFSSKANTSAVIMQSSWIAFLDLVATVQLTCQMIFKLLSDIISTKSKF